jgi:hypothetical protein
VRIPDKFLVHRVDIVPLAAVGSSVGKRFDDARPAVRSIVVDKRKLVVDERMDSATKGQEIQASTHILVQPEEFVSAGSKITVWKGTPRERTGVVVATAYGEHPIAPSSAQMWIV